MRLDVYLSAHGVKSREEAKRLINDGDVLVNGKPAKPSLDVSDTDDIKVLSKCRYVSRGGLKLERAVEEFGICLGGCVCLDIGASTGGFTDVCLQNGAGYVYALDVGHSQLDEKLRGDSRVKCIEGVNIRNVTAGFFEKTIDFICCDVSFISLRLVLPVIYSLLGAGKKAVVLIKPQFELTKGQLGKGGIVRSEALREQVKRDISAFAAGCGFKVQGVIPSPIKGGDGNEEYLMALYKIDGQAFASHEH
ncbi:MAG: TlyA family RNA methyltransferase [Oscillospiraceae bacterium]|nr:TlyA family RNA methyltransferase [Oscillospiraceae bacterium]